MADLGNILNKALPLNKDGSLPAPITLNEFERRIHDVLYPRVREGRDEAGRRVVLSPDNALISGSVQALADFGCIRYTSPTGGPSTRARTDLIHRTVTDLGPARSQFGPSPGHGTRQSVEDEFGVEHMIPIADVADEIARVRAARKRQRIEQIRADMIEAGEYEPATA